MCPASFLRGLGQVLLSLEEGGVLPPVCWKLLRMWRISGKPFPRAVVSACSTPGGGAQPHGALRKSDVKHSEREAHCIAPGKN